MLTIVMGAFFALMIVAVFFAFFQEKNNARSFVRFSLEGIDYFVTERMDKIRSMSIPEEAEWMDEYILNDLAKGIPLQDAVDRLILDVRSGYVSEVDLVSPDGIIIASTVEDNIGLDLHSNAQSAEFLCLLKGDTDVYSQYMVLRSPDSEQMKYYGTLVPEYGGILLEGLDQETYAAYKDATLRITIDNNKFGRTGYFLYLDNNLRILSGQALLHQGEIFSIPYDIKELAESGDIVKADVYGVPSYVGVFADNNNYIVAVYSLSEAWESWDFTITALIIIDCIVLIILFAALRHLIRRHVERGVVIINDSLAAISGGDLEKRVDFRDSIEFDELSGGINYTVDRLKELIKEAEGRIDAELVLAAEIQKSILPHVFPPFPDRNEFELYACMIPAKEVGGDFYDFFLIDDDHLALVMADVSGKGLPAAMFMVMSKDKLRHSIQEHGTDVAEAVREVNSELCKENDAGLFVTIWVGVLTISTGHMDYVDAGHDYPAICRSGREFVIEKDVHCAMVGAMSFTEFKAGSFDLKAGDILYLYTDGVTEAINAFDEMFRMERMLDVLNRNKDASVQDIDAAVRAAIAGFVKDAPQFDDTTTLCFRYKG